MSVSSAFPRTNCMTCFYDSLASKSKAASLGQSDNLKNGRSSGSGPPRPRRKHAEATANNPGNANTPTGARLSQSELMPEKTVKRWLQDAGDDALASDDGPIFSTVAELVEALKRSIPKGTKNAERKKVALRLAHELLRGTKDEQK
jgi:hypothetical protein